MKKIPYNDLVYYGGFSIVAILYAIIVIVAIYSVVNPPESDGWVHEEVSLEATAWDGSYFSTENVYNYYETDSSYIVSYYGPEGFCEDIDIPVDETTYRIIDNASENGVTIVGSMQKNDGVFTLLVK